MKQRIIHYLNRESVSYLIVGGITTALSWGLFTLALHLGLGTIAANNMANALAILFAFFANKAIVFRSSSWAAGKVLYEFAKFGAARLLTHVLETVALYVLVEMLGLPGFLMKGLTMAFIQVLGNYALSKWVVFVKK
ncbi:MAG: GtrA family protein [Defluviitaleaceae bacterium]|nr:GtrA family protein [Defluviitaleaceae bacterium]MCL2240808.1 GtrA family protein [Defluviitaleaceae bacterium]